ncbi:MAG: ABC transporter permease [Lachnospiraceae bacterium]|nr:ABC transporter permease [Lachnospiraceae bacterium]
MVKYICKRILWMIPVILGVAILIFSLMYFTPGDPAKTILGSEATEAQLATKREQMGLDQPYLVQLGTYMSDVFLHLDFGESYITGQSVISELVSRMPRTAVISIVAIIITAVIGIPLGVSAATHAGKWQDSLSMVVALAGVSMPDFWVGMLLVLAFSLRLGWLPSTGIGSWTCFILPIACTAVSNIANVARQARSSMLEVIRSDYVVTARSKGLSERRVIWGHALPNALIPVVTVLGGRFANCLGGSAIIETLFSIPGVGLYVLNGVNNRDYPVVRGSVIVLAIVAAVGMLIVDLVYAFIDPRIKAQYQGKGKG